MTTQNQILEILLKNKQRNNLVNYDLIYNYTPPNSNNTPDSNANILQNANNYISNTHIENMNYINSLTTPAYPTTPYYNNSTNNINNGYSNNVSFINNNYILTNMSIKSNTTIIASQLNIMNVNSIYCTTLINEFNNDSRFLQVINLTHNTRRRAAGRFKVNRHRNNYGKNGLGVVLPTIFNALPLDLINVRSFTKRKIIIKKHFISLQ